MILHYEIEVDDSTAPQVVGIMMQTFGIMSRFITDNPLTKEVVRDCKSSEIDTSIPSNIVDTRFRHMKIIRKDM